MTDDPEYQSEGDATHRRWGLNTTTAASVELLRAFQSGDDEALDRLWTRYLPRLKRWAHRRLPPASRNHLGTDDLVQDAFVRSLARLRTFVPRNEGGLFAYFRTIVLNQVRDHARQAVRRPVASELDSGEHANPEPSPLDRVLGREVMDRYQSALETLSEEDQQLIVAYVELRCTDRELAELFEKPSADAARMARGRALAKLAERLEADRAKRERSQ
jgi:RNA polymerase sigma-70 factor (ECF subfamily)